RPIRPTSIPGRIDAGALARIALTLAIGFCAFYLAALLRTVRSGQPRSRAGSMPGRSPASP
ncbi:hypothetical protein CTI14_71285, partial [Methylobacterium radiotolerans]